MDEFALLGILAVIVVLAIPVGVIVALVQISGLKARLQTVEAALRRAEADRRRPEVARVESTEPQPAPPERPEPDARRDPWRAGAISGPEATRPAEPEAPAAPSAPLREPVATVMTVQRASALGDWLKANWVYAIAALSLAFAGIFFVRYGMERGLLPPAARVILAILFGATLIAAGEVVRRRSGDGPRVASAYVPSTFSGAGLVSIFAGVLAARQLYDLIGSGTAFAGLAATAALAVLLGWFYGPFLAAFGLLGAGLAPFLVGGGSDTVWPVQAYFLIVASAGLAIDAVRRWAWVSVLALVVGYGGTWLLLAGVGGVAPYALAVSGLVIAAILVPCLKLQPDQDGPMMAEFLWSRDPAAWPGFPARLAAGAVAASSAALFLVPATVATEGVILLLLLAGLAALVTVWSRGARALSDLAALPALAFLARLVMEGMNGLPLASAYLAQSLALRAPESAAPMTAGMILAIATLLTLLAAWRSGGFEYRAHWAAGAALFAPLTAVVLEFFWAPAQVIGAYPWALHIIALAALMAFLATRFAAADGDDRRRAAYAVLSCLSLIALALFLILTKAALTVALAALIPVAASLDRRFRLPEMGWFIQAAAAGLSWRLVVDPGLIWAVDDAQLWEVVLTYGGAVAAMAGSLWLLKDLDRKGAKVFLESGGAAALALFANVLLTRWIISDGNEDWIATHWATTLNALPWLILCLTQLYRLRIGGILRWLRIAIATVAGLLALFGIGLAVLPLNPLFDQPFSLHERQVHGPYIVDTLLVAYGLPALVLLAVLPRMGHLPRLLRGAIGASGVILAILYVALEIRRFWQGDDLSVAGVSQGELYSYTVAMMTVGAGLLYQAIARRSTALRRAALAVVGVTIAKVFLIDASGLTGLTRVFSFLALGLALIGLAWLDRWAAERAGARQGAEG